MSENAPDPRRRLSTAEIDAAGLTDWRLLAGRLQARFAPADYAAGLDLVARIGAAAEDADHHPETTLTYGHVVLTLSSHDVGGVTSRDVRMARRISALAAELGAGADVAGHPRLGEFDFLDRYVSDLPQVLDLETIRDAGVRIGADPMGGASVAYWGEIGRRHGLDLTVVNPEADPTFGFMTLDWDGKIRMDCSSPHAMASLIERMRPDADGEAPFDVATGNDADADRHGIVTPDGGLMNPNHFLAVAIDYLYRHRRSWPADAGVGKTLVSSSMIDRVAGDLGRELVEVPVGFKWFVPGLLTGTGVFGGEESAGASFVKFDGGAWSTDKDGMLLCLLAAEIIAVTGQSPSERYRDLVALHGSPAYARIDAPATAEQKARLKTLSPDDVTVTELAGETILATLTNAPGNDAPIGGLKVVTQNAWFAARPSGTEDVYKIYAESFRGPEHLKQVQEEAQRLVDAVIG
mgnify:CR=1 FL=1